MECSICLHDEGSFRTLWCGHSFHHDCIKKWYMKGDSGQVCPICRQLIYGKFIRSWKKQRIEQRKNDLWFEYFDGIVDTYIPFLKYSDSISIYLMDELNDLQYIFNNLTFEELTLEYYDSAFFGYYYEYPDYNLLMFVGDHAHDILANKISYTTLNNNSLNMFST